MRQLLLSCWLPLSLVALLSACGSKTHQVAAQQGQLLTFRRTASMDTVTAILQGQLVSLPSQQPLAARVQLTTLAATYQADTTPAGTFLFFHIPAGDYTLMATCAAGIKVTCTPIQLGTGDVVETTIGMNCYSGSSK
jgi:hypothetical protein